MENKKCLKPPTRFCSWHLSNAKQRHCTIPLIWLWSVTIWAKVSHWILERLAHCMAPACTEAPSRQLVHQTPHYMWLWPLWVRVEQWAKSIFIDIPKSSAFWNGGINMYKPSAVMVGLSLGFAHDPISCHRLRPCIPWISWAFLEGWQLPQLSLVAAWTTYPAWQNDLFPTNRVRYKRNCFMGM